MAGEAKFEIEDDCMPVFSKSVNYFLSQVCCLWGTVCGLGSIGLMLSLGIRVI